MDMMDIDFRWVVPPHTTTEPAVLQWRKKIIDPRWRHPGEGEWTEWQDVRTEAE